MALPEFADQKREQERQALKVLLTRTLLASLALHGGLLLLNLKPLWTATQSEPEEIAIVVTESESEPEPEPEPEPEEPLKSPEAQTEVLTDNSSTDNSSTVADPAPIAAIALPEPIAPELPPESPVTPEPVIPDTPLVSETPPPETVTAPLTPANPEASPVPAPQPTALEQAAAPERSFRDLLEQLRRDRAARQSSGSRSGEGTNPATVGEGRGNSETGQNSGTDAGTETAPAANEVAAGSSNPPAPETTGGQSRRISCRNCPDVDYPEEALRAGQEGTVKVLVDYDENGNVISATLVDSSGHTVLDQAVLEAVQEKYRLDDSGGAGSTVLSVDMTIDGSEFNRQAEERGDRRAVDIPPPPPVVTEPEPANTATEPITAPESLIEATDEPAGTPMPTSPMPTSPTEVPPESIAPTTVDGTLDGTVDGNIDTTVDTTVDPAPLPITPPSEPAVESLEPAPELPPAPIEEAAEPPPEPVYEPEPVYAEPEPIEQFTEPEAPIPAFEPVPSDGVPAE
ncbi:MAG: TonB family protein [Elainella sp. Prado103]|nr:TonB family protein [Elainella sp. Prado103]